MPKPQTLHESELWDERSLMGSGWDGEEQNIKYVDSDGLQHIYLSPFVDIDTTYVFNTDGTLQQKIESGIGKIRTTVYTYSGGYLVSEAVVIT